VERATGPPTAVNLGFLDRSHYFFIQVTPHLSSEDIVAPIKEPGTSNIVTRNSKD
jgi:hypothetical protein